MLSLSQLVEALEQSQTEFMEAAERGDMTRMLELNHHRHIVKDEIIRYYKEFVNEILTDHQRLLKKVG